MPAFKYDPTVLRIVAFYREKAVLPATCVDMLASVRWVVVNVSYIAPPIIVGTPSCT